MTSNSVTSVPKYALVLWLDEKKVSPILSKFITNKQMLYNNRIVDLIAYPKSEGKEPKDGWQKYSGVVLQLGNSKQELTKKSADLMNAYYKEAENSHEGKGFVLVLWLDSEESSVIAESYILDKRMLNNSKLSDLIPRPIDDEQEPDEGWDFIKGSVLKYSANKGDLERDRWEIVAEYINNVKQNTQPSTSRDGNESSSDSMIEAGNKRGLEDSGDSSFEAKYKKLKQEHANTKATLAATKVQLADKEDLLNITIKDIPRIIQEAVQEILTKDFLVSVVKSALPTVPVGGIAAAIAGPAEGRGDIERAKAAIIQQSGMEEEQFDIHSRPKDFSKVTKNLVMGLFNNDELMTSTLTGNPKDKDVLPNVLDKPKITLIHNYVTARFPGTTISQVNKAIGEKLRDYRKSKGFD
ncbi:hypothetical protein DAPPUDRAFT_335876 [Daphnia pulex]|uniref:BEN domain-containing protein n=1 Tax=Daphnia pulex TaxID=6669 RepID=E9HYM8_DAPPU|nr:hypothetical protein DAPPUDRAFT_335876 [Daphnia pulex]|eukprot:EFX63152.1 hypothetical protein DAPPUDRAFT_335876 [Daphnia pulex]